MGAVYTKRLQACKEHLYSLFAKLERMSTSKSRLECDYAYWFSRGILNDLCNMANLHTVVSLGGGRVKGTLSFDGPNAGDFYILQYILEDPNGGKLFPYRIDSLHNLDHYFVFHSDEGHDKFFPMQI